MTISIKSGFSITKMSYNFAQSPELYDFHKKNLLRPSFTFIFIVWKLQTRAVFRGYYHQKTRIIRTGCISSTNWGKNSRIGRSTQSKTIRCKKESDRACPYCAPGKVSFVLQTFLPLRCTGNLYAPLTGKTGPCSYPEWLRPEDDSGHRSRN